MLKRSSQSDHDYMVEAAANFLGENGYAAIKADIAGFDSPDKITWERTGKGHIPDITADGDSVHLFEVETDDSIDSQHTKDQWTLFAAYARQKNATFFLFCLVTSILTCLL